MKASDARAENLFIRLFSYTPRPEREALEDFCTEALVWCLRKSAIFRKRFFALTRIPVLTKCAGLPEFHTQFSYDNWDDSVEDDQTDTAVGGRFDVVIQSISDSSFVVVMETKVGAPFGKDQLKRYRNELMTPTSFPSVLSKHRYLATLTTMGEGSDLADAALRWSDVQQISKVIGDSNDDHISSTIKQFSDFLFERGLGSMKLRKVDKTLLNRWSEVKDLEEQLKTIIKSLRNQREIRPSVGQRQVKSIAGEWIGVGGISGFWAGFGISKIEGSTELFLWTEITVPGDKRHLRNRLSPSATLGLKQAIKYLEAYNDSDAVNFGTLVEGNSRFVFAKTVDGSLNGNPDEVFKWLLHTSGEALSLLKAVKSG